MGLFSRKARGDVLKVYAASDLHGSTTCFRKLLQAGDWYGADILVVAGDLTGKLVVPIVSNGGGAYRSEFGGGEHHLTEEEVPAHEEAIENAGLYPYQTTPDEMAELGADKSRVDEIWHRLVSERAQRWLELGEERLAEKGMDCYFVAGNDDFPELDALLGQGERMKFIDGAVGRIDDDHEVLGLGVSNPTPWNAPRDVAETEISTRLETLADQLETPESAMFIVHVPPNATQLDLCPEIDEDFRPTGGGDNLINVGSTAVREVIAEYQPLVSFHGHIHESRGIDHIGRTTCVNPGSEYSQGILRGALVNISRDGVVGHLFVSG